MILGVGNIFYQPTSLDTSLRYTFIIRLLDCVVLGRVAVR